MSRVVAGMKIESFSLDPGEGATGQVLFAIISVTPFLLLLVLWRTTTEKGLFFPPLTGWVEKQGKKKTINPPK